MQMKGLLCNFVGLLFEEEQEIHKYLYALLFSR